MTSFEEDFSPCNDSVGELRIEISSFLFNILIGFCGCVDALIVLVLCGIGE
jgi:hypothetical protein